MDSDCMLYLVTNSDCMCISKSNQYGKLSLYLPTIQNACSSLTHSSHTVLSCTYPLFRMHVHLVDGSIILRNVVLTHYSECMFILPWNLPDSIGCTYPLFRMHVHPQINIILYNRHLLNVRALLFLLLYI